MKTILAAALMFVIGAGAAYLTEGASSSVGGILGGGIYGLLIFGLYHLLSWISLRADRKSQDRNSN